MELDEEVNQFKLSIKHIISLDESIDLLTPEQSPQGIPIDCVVMIYFLYYGLLFDIHSLLMLPWYSHNCPKKLEPFHSQVRHSCDVVASTARAAILGSRLVQLHANTQVLLAVYIPIRAVNHALYTYSQKPRPGDGQVGSGLDGYRGGICVALGVCYGWKPIVFFVREFARFSRTAVEGARNASISQNPHTFSSVAPETLNLTNSEMPNELQQPHSNAGYYGDAIHDYDPNFALDLETWSTLIPIEGNPDDRPWDLFSI